MTDDPTDAVLERLDAGGYGVQDKRGYWMARCPGHDDRQASLGIRRGEDGKCLLNCFVCGKGTAEAVTRALDMPLSDLFVPSLNGNGRAPISVAALAKAKGFTADYLRGLGLSEGELYGAPAVLIPYRLGDGSVAPVTRARTGVSGRQSKWRRGDALMPYGLERLEGWRSQGALILVEGESDCWALWGADLPALGLPGAQSARCLAAEHVAGFSRLYVVREPDEGGKAFVAGVAARLAQVGFAGTLKVVAMPAGIKDPCELHQANPAGFHDRMVQLLQSAAPVEPEPEAEPELLPTLLMSEVEAQPVHWLWEPRIPSRMLTLLMGDPGVGKSFITAALAAALTRGWRLPGSPDAATFKPRNVLMFASEDSPSYALKPRLEAIGADCTRVRVLDNDAANWISFDEARLALMERTIAWWRPTLVTIDPITEYFGGEVDMHRDNEVRPVLKRLAEMAARYECAILYCMHMNKAAHGRGIYRALGSIAFPARARCHLLAGTDPEDKTKGAIVHIKSNVGPLADAIGYSLREGRFEWCADTQLTAESLLVVESEGDTSVLTATVNALRDVLTGGPVPALAAKKAMRDAGFSERTLDRAKTRLGVNPKPQPIPGKQGPGVWYWFLPGHEHREPNPEYNAEYNAKSRDSQNPGVLGVQRPDLATYSPEEEPLDDETRIGRQKSNRTQRTPGFVVPQPLADYSASYSSGEDMPGEPPHSAAEGEGHKW